MIPVEDDATKAAGETTSEAISTTETAATASKEASAEEEGTEKKQMEVKPDLKKAPSLSENVEIEYVSEGLKELTEKDPNFSYFMRIFDAFKVNWIY